MRFISVIVLILLGSCARTPAPRPPAPAPARPVPPPAPPPPPVAADWIDRPITPGTWNYRADPRGPIASFGAAGAGAAFAVRCDRGSGAVILSRAGDARGTTMTVRTTTATRALPSRPTGEAVPAVAATLGADDRLLDAIGFSRGRFAIETPPLGPLILPAWPEILRVVEDCRD